MKRTNLWVIDQFNRSFESCDVLVDLTALALARAAVAAGRGDEEYVGTGIEELTPADRRKQERYAVSASRDSYRLWPAP